MDDYYQLFSYLRRVKICPKQIRRDYGGRAAFILNYTCPVVVKCGGQPLDELAADYGFECGDALYEYILQYYPKYKWLMDMEEGLK